jgi:hypothetical protein
LTWVYTTLGIFVLKQLFDNFSNMKKYKLYLAFLVSALIVVVYGCADHDIPVVVPSCDGVAAISYDDQVKPIIEAKCAIVGDGGCHNGGNGPDLQWTVFDNLQERALNGVLQDRITRPSGTEGRMPKIGELTEDELEILYCWAAQGAPNN